MVYLPKYLILLPSCLTWRRSYSNRRLPNRRGRSTRRSRSWRPSAPGRPPCNRRVSFRSSPYQPPGKNLNIGVFKSVVGRLHRQDFPGVKHAANRTCTFSCSYFLKLIIPKARAIGKNTYSLLGPLPKGGFFLDGYVSLENPSAQAAIPGMAPHGREEKKRGHGASWRGLADEQPINGWRKFLIRLDVGVGRMVVDGLEVFRLHRVPGEVVILAQVVGDFPHHVLDEHGIAVGLLGDELLILAF